MSDNTSTIPDRYYLHVQGKKKGHQVCKASNGQIVAIKDLIKKKREGNMEFFISKIYNSFQKLIKIFQECQI